VGGGTSFLAFIKKYNNLNVFVFRINIANGQTEIFNDLLLFLLRCFCNSHLLFAIVSRVDALFASR